MGNFCKHVRTEDTWSSSANWDLKCLPPESEYQISLVEIHLILRKWKLLTTDKTVKVFAYTLFEKLFVSFPDMNKLLFVPESGDFISSQQWKEHPLFAQHVREVVNSLGTIIQLLDEERKLREYLRNLEEFHRSLRGMKKSYIEAFVKIIDESMAANFGSLYTGDTKRAFRKVLTMLYLKLTWRLLV